METENSQDNSAQQHSDQPTPLQNQGGSFTNSTTGTPPPFQQQPPFGQFGGGFGQQNLPNAVVALVLGILAIPSCCFYGIFGLIFGIIAWVLGAGDVRRYHQNPGVYTESSYKNAKAGKICGMVATILSALTIIFVVLAIVGAISNPDIYDRIIRDMK
ncbi:CCC motif membrane protein [Pedobacter sandarakinus]|uniref:CCC motif membrane protein n=1 Tax=Pedobacter sandarakinus TaxID=353156 RepID=UPI002245AE95|nr:CCC motif membrane protein [Pedobacter sandarakinus]MCX2576244.1 CCC motif membrane protein [Pedobacter sandarakinus]